MGRWGALVGWIELLEAARHPLLQNILGCGNTSGELEAYRVLTFKFRVHGSDLCRRRWNSVWDVHKLCYLHLRALEDGGACLFGPADPLGVEGRWQWTAGM